MKIIKNRVDINERKDRKRIKKINEIKSLIVETNTTDKPLLRKNRKREKKLIINISNKKGNMTTLSIVIKISNCHAKLYGSSLDNLDKRTMLLKDKFTKPTHITKNK